MGKNRWTSDQAEPACSPCDRLLRHTLVLDSEPTGEEDGVVCRAIVFYIKVKSSHWTWRFVTVLWLSPPKIVERTYAVSCLRLPISNESLAQLGSTLLSPRPERLVGQQVPEEGSILLRDRLEKL